MTVTLPSTNEARRTPGTLVTLTVALAIGANAVLASTSAQQPAAPPVSQQARIDAARSLIRAVLAAVQGRLAPADDVLAWSNDFLRGQSDTTYVPFTVAIDPAALDSPRVAMHLFVTPSPDTTAISRTQTAGVLQPAEPATVFERLYFADLDQTGPDGRYRLRRAFSVPQGRYDVYLAVAGVASADTASAERDPPTLLLKRTLAVPDFTSPALSSSTIMLAEAVEVVSQPVGSARQDLEPYTLGATRIVPAADTVFAPSDELAVLFLVYNARVSADGQPNVSVDYEFYQRDAGAVRFFNRTPTQLLNTPPPAGVSAAGELVAGQAVSLQGFPEGAYRLAITVTDNTGGGALSRHVDFTVRP